MVDVASFVASNFTVVTQSSDEWDCLCPWHGDKTPSLRINIKKGLYFCHGCHKKGSIERLAEERGTTIAQPDIKDQMQMMVEQLHAPARRDRIYSDSTLAQYKGSTDYWSKMRGLGQATIDSFDLGQDEIERAAIIPMRSYTGDLIGLIKRRFGNVRPKYLYPVGMRKADHLFGSWMLEQSHQRVAIVEGSVDALAMWDAGIPALAVLGSRISDNQVALLNRLGVDDVVLFTDNDAAGEIGLTQMIETLPPSIMWSIAIYKDDWGSDPASLTIEQRREAFDNAVSQFTLTDS